MVRLAPTASDRSFEIASAYPVGQEGGLERVRRCVSMHARVEHEQVDRRLNPIAEDRCELVLRGEDPRHLGRRGLGEHSNHGEMYAAAALGVSRIDLDRPEVLAQLDDLER